MMKGFLSTAALSLAVGEASAHYIFQQFSLNGVQYPVYEYIRKNSNYNSPVTDLTSDDLRCNVGATGAGTDTITVKAGDQFTFTTDTPVYHDGPISIYMSKAPGAAADYDGSGGWFKIKDWGPTFNSDGSSTWPLQGSYTYNIPTNIPSGDYLLRIQSLGIHNPWPAGIPQFYTACAQITVTGGGSCNPSPTVLIPGFISDTDPGYTVNIYTNFHNYTIPGPAVYTCGSGGSPPPTSATSKPAGPSTTLVTSTKSSSAAAPPPATSSSAPSGGCSTAKYGQCGGQGFTGCTTCASGSTCQAQNSFYSQCL